MKRLNKQNVVNSLFVTCVFGVLLAYGQDGEKKVKMSDLPAPVQKTVREQSKGATIRGFAQETENGKTSYEVEMRVKGHNKDVLIDSSGAVLAVEEQVALNALRPAVKAELVRKERRRSPEPFGEYKELFAFQFPPNGESAEGCSHGIAFKRSG